MSQDLENESVNGEYVGDLDGFKVGTVLCQEYFHDKHGNSIPQLLAALVKLTAEQNELNARLLNRVENLTEIVQKLTPKPKPPKK